MINWYNLITKQGRRLVHKIVASYCRHQGGLVGTEIIEADDAFMCQLSKPANFGSNNGLSPVGTTTLFECQLCQWEVFNEIRVKIHFHTRKWNWKCHLQNVCHYVKSSMCHFIKASMAITGSNYFLPLGAVDSAFLFCLPSGQCPVTIRVDPASYVGISTWPSLPPGNCAGHT